MAHLVRSLDDGQLGEVVEREGRKWVKLDRGREEILRPYSPSRYRDETENRPLSRPQVARIAYEADRALRLATGEYGSAVKEWINLKDEERIKWVEKGPSGGRRRDLWGVILSHFMEDP